MNKSNSAIECRENNWHLLPPNIDGEAIKNIEKAISVCNRRIVSAGDYSENLPIYFNSYRREIRFSGISGFLSLGPATFTIRPKFMADGLWTPRLNNTLLLGGRHSRIVLFPGTLSANWLNSRFIDPFARLFTRSLLLALESHPLLAYRRIEKDLTFIRGRILPEKQLAKSLGRQHKVSCSFSGFTKDNEYINLLRWAALEFQSLARTRETRISLKAVLDRLPQTSAGEYSISSLFRPLPPGMAAYRESFSIAQELAKARRRAATSSNSDKSVCGVVAIMHACYEAMVSFLYRRVSYRLGIETKAQSTWRFIKRDGLGLGDATRYVRPDDILCCKESKKPILVSDSKYVGRIGSDIQGNKHRLDASIFYQVVCSCQSVGTQAGLIIQPFIEDMDETVPSFEKWDTDLGLQGKDLSIGILRLDFRVLNNHNALRLLEQQLEVGIRNMGVLPECI